MAELLCSNEMQVKVLMCCCEEVDIPMRQDQKAG